MMDRAHDAIVAEFMSRVEQARRGLLLADTAEEHVLREMLREGYTIMPASEEGEWDDLDDAYEDAQRDNEKLKDRVQQLESALKKIVDMAKEAW